MPLFQQVMEILWAMRRRHHHHHRPNSTDVDMGEDSDDFENDDLYADMFGTDEDGESDGDVPDLPDSFDQTSVVLDLPWETANLMNQTRSKRSAGWREYEQRYYDEDQYDQYSEYDDGYDR